MIPANTEEAVNNRSLAEAKARFPSYGSDPKVLADIYQEDIHIAIWQRKTGKPLTNAVSRFVTACPMFEIALTVSPDRVDAEVSEATSWTAPRELVDDVSQLVSMFCDLFGLQRVGLRLATLSRAMCPRFHVDHVPCRLITTYQSVATEWLPHDAVDRAKLGTRRSGKTDLETGLFKRESDIQQLTRGDVALLKGERWEGNENAGLVHRSPTVPEGQNRLLLSVDVSD